MSPSTPKAPENSNHELLANISQQLAIPSPQSILIADERTNPEDVLNIFPTAADIQISNPETNSTPQTYDLVISLGQDLISLLSLQGKGAADRRLQLASKLTQLIKKLNTQGLMIMARHAYGEDQIIAIRRVKPHQVQLASPKKGYQYHLIHSEALSLLVSDINENLSRTAET